MKKIINKIKESEIVIYEYLIWSSLVFVLFLRKLYWYR